MMEIPTLLIGHGGKIEQDPLITVDVVRIQENVMTLEIHAYGNDIDGVTFYVMRSSLQAALNQKIEGEI